MTRPSIREMIQGATSQIVAGMVRSWLDEHRDELVAAVAQANNERGAAFLKQFCERFPATAGLVTLAMGGPPELALSSIAVFDQSLADQLAPYMDNFKSLQQYWQRGAAND